MTRGRSGSQCCRLVVRSGSAHEGLAEVLYFPLSVAWSLSFSDAYVVGKGRTRYYYTRFRGVSTDMWSKVGNIHVLGGALEHGSNVVHDAEPIFGNSKSAETLRINKRKTAVRTFREITVRPMKEIDRIRIGPLITMFLLTDLVRTEDSAVLSSNVLLPQDSLFCWVRNFHDSCPNVFSRRFTQLR